MIGRWLVRFILFAGIWCVISAGDLSSWLIGFPTVLVATIASFWLSPKFPWNWKLIGLARFIPYFLRQSLLSGVDVARRAFHPVMPLSPDVLEYLTRLPEGHARVFFINTISLLPGTLSADVEGDALTIHVLDGNQPVAEDLARLEHFTARLFGLSLGPVK